MYEKSCPVVETLRIISGKWKVLILHKLVAGPVRFNALQRSMPEISQRMLTLQLRGLERDGIVRRTVYPVIPPSVEYALTDFGKTLCPVLEALHDWGVRYGDRIPE
ncbi:MAG: winged helix-turn-helix transcriptional regulator [Desulfopila sp.]